MSQNRVFIWHFPLLFSYEGMRKYRHFKAAYPTSNNRNNLLCPETQITDSNPVSPSSTLLNSFLRKVVLSSSRKKAIRAIKLHFYILDPIKEISISND